MNNTRDAIPPFGAATGSASCFVCGKPAWSGNKRDARRVCFDCFECSCPKCGHETFWVVSRKHPNGGWLCFSLTCPGWYEQPPFETPNSEVSDRAGDGARW